MSTADEDQGVNIDVRDALAIVRDVDAHSCVVQIQSGVVTKDKHYLFQGFGLGFLAGKAVWVRGTKAGLFFKYPIHSHPLAQMHAALSRSDGASTRVRLQNVD